MQVLLKAAKEEKEKAGIVRAAAQTAIQMAAQAREAELHASQQKVENARLEREAAARQQAVKMDRLKQVTATDWHQAVKL